MWVQAKVWGSTSQSCIISVEAAVCFWMKNRYTKIWVNSLYTWKLHELPGSFLKSALITGYHFNSLQWQLTSCWCGFRQGMVLMLGTGGSPPGDMFTVTSVWLIRRNNRWMFNHSLLLQLNKKSFVFVFFLQNVLKRFVFFMCTTRSDLMRAKIIKNSDFISFSWLLFMVVTCCLS